MILLMALLLSLAGWIVLSAAMTRHQQQLFRRELTAPVSRRLRWSGAGLIIAGLIAAMIGSGIVIGLIEWIALLAVTGSGFAFALPYVAESLHPAQTRTPER